MTVNHLLWITGRSFTTVTTVWRLWRLASPVATSRRWLCRSWVPWLFGANRSFLVQWRPLSLLSGRAVWRLSRTWRTTWTIRILIWVWSSQWLSISRRQRSLLGTKRSSFSWSSVRTTGLSLRARWPSWKWPSLGRIRSPWWSTKNRGSLNGWSSAWTSTWTRRFFTNNKWFSRWHLSRTSWSMWTVSTGWPTTRAWLWIWCWFSSIWSFLL